MLIVDSQVHIWLSGVPSETHKPQPVFSAEDLLKEMDEAGVSRAVLNAVRWDHGGTQAARDAASRGEFDSNKTATDAVMRHPARFGAIRRIAPNDSAEAGTFPRLLDQPGLLGARLMFTGREASWLMDGTSDWYWPAAEKHGIPTTVRVMGGDALDYIGTVAERHPGLPIAIDHLGTQHRSGGAGGMDLTVDDAAFAYQPNLLALARFPNVAVKATAVTDYSSQPYPNANIHSYVREIYDRFGPDRMFWGSDLSRLRGSYRRCVTFFTEELPWLSEHDKELIMGRAYCNWFHWSIAGP